MPAVVGVSAFYGAAAGAAAALLGLLFVAMRIRPERLTPALRTRRQTLAESTFSIYTHLFLTAMVFLVPDLSASTQAAVVLAGAAIGVFRAVRAWPPLWRGIAADAPERLWQTVWVLLGPLVCYSLLIFFAATALLQPAPSALAMEATGVFIGLFLVVIRNTWNLLVEGAGDVEP